MGKLKKALAGAVIPVYMIAALPSTVLADTNNAAKLNNAESKKTQNSITEILSMLRLNDQLIIKSQSNGYFNVTWNGYDGWVFGKYLQKQVDNDKTKDKTDEKTKKIKPSTYDNINSDYVNVRSGPGTTYKIITRLNKGVKVGILTNSNGWANVVLSDDTTGWVNAQYIGEKKDTEDNTVGTVYGDSVNVRSGAGTDYDIISRLYYGDSVSILSSSNGWYKVKLSDGTIGWVIERYVATGTSRALDTSARVLANARRYLGVPYIYGGSSPSGFDCSGFVQYVFNQTGISLPRVAADQATQGVKVSMSELQRGDLVFFDTDGGHNYINHVGIYIGNGQFIHASSGSGKVVITDLYSSYYQNAYMTARRVVR